MGKTIKPLPHTKETMEKALATSLGLESPEALEEAYQRTVLELREQVQPEALSPRGTVTP